MVQKRLPLFVSDTFVDMGFEAPRMVSRAKRNQVNLETSDSPSRGGSA